MLFLLVAVLAAGSVIGCAQARAGVNANLSIDAEAGEGSPALVEQNQSDNGSAGIASVAYGWPVSFLGPTAFDCAAAGCAEATGGATASVDEAAGILRAGAAGSVLIGNAPDPSDGGISFVKSESSIDDWITLSQDATVVVQGTVHGTLAATNGDPDQLEDPWVETDVKVGFCCRRFGEGFGLIGGYDQQFFPDAAGGSTTTIDDTFSIPVELPAGDSEFQADLSHDVHMLVDGVPGMVLSADGRSDFTGTVSFRIVVPDNVVATSSSGLLPIVGGAPAAPSDTTPPVSAASVAPAPNATGWNDGPVTVHIGAADEDGGSGVASITVDGSTSDGNSVDVPLSAEGATTLTYYATDAAGNAESPHTLTVRIDDTPPSVTYDGNAGTYTVDQQVAITCHAADALSGMASSTCVDVTGPAYSFALGQNTFSASATDAAGNTGTGNTSFTVVADPASIATLAMQFVAGSSTYQSPAPPRQQAVQKLVDLATRAVVRIVPTLDPEQKTAFLRVYGDALARLVRGGWLTAGQAATLTNLAAAR
jgi:hypothetical protein